MRTAFRVAFLAALPLPLWAADVFDLSLDDLLNQRTDVASRNPENVLASPSSVTVFNRREIAALGITHLSQLLNLMTGVQALFEPPEGRTNLLQGRATPESYGQGFLLLIDGQRSNEHYTGGWTLSNRLLPLANVERVELVRGPGSALYGGNAFNGVINIVTRRDSNELELETGSLSHRRIALNHSQNGRDWRYDVFVQSFRDDGDQFDAVFDRFGRQTDSQDPRQGSDVSLHAEYATAFVDARYSRRDFEDFYVFGRLYDGVNEEMTQHLTWRIGYDWIYSNALTIKLATSQTHIRWEPFAVLVLQGEEPFTEANWLQGAVLDYDGQDASVDLIWHWQPGWRINAGLIYDHANVPTAATRSNYDVITFDYLGDVRVLRADRYRFVDDESRHVVGAYAQWQMPLFDSLNMTLGIRRDDYNDIGGETHPRAALVWQPDDRNTYKLLYGSAFRAPGLGDLYDRESGQTVGNPDLDAIRVRTVETAWLHKGEHWQSGITLFDADSENLLSSVALPDGRTLVSNVGHNHSQGMELEWNWSPIEKLLTKFSFTHIYKNTTTQINDAGATLAEDYASKNFASVIVNWRHGQWNFNWNAYWRDDIPVIKNAGGSVHNVAITYEWRDNWFWQLKSFNASDSDMDIPARGSALGRDSNGVRQRNVPLRGRQWLLALHWRY